MEDIGKVIVTIIVMPVLIFVLTGVVGIAFKAWDEMREQYSISGKVFTFVNFTICVLTGVAFALAPVIGYGVPGFVGMVIGGVLVYVWTKEKSSKSPES
jgi:hypothetical protein